MPKTALQVDQQSGGMFSIEDQSLSTGNRYYVDDSGTDSVGRGQNPDNPVKTIDFAVGLCAAGKGDIIYPMPGHAEDISTATSLVLDVAGVSIIGLGEGALRPRLTFTAAASTISITAANCRMQNIWLRSNFTNGVTIGVTLGAAADGCVLRNIVMEEATNAKEFLIAISVAAGCNDVLIEDFQFHGIFGGGDVSCIDWVGASNRSVLRRAWMHGDWAASVVDGLAAASVGIRYEDVTFYQDDATLGLGIDESDTSTGLMTNCWCMNKKDTVEGFTGNLMAYNQCYGSNVVNKQGILEPAVDS